MSGASERANGRASGPDSGLFCPTVHSPFENHQVVVVCRLSHDRKGCYSSNVIIAVVVVVPVVLVVVVVVVVLVVLVLNVVAVVVVVIVVVAIIAQCSPDSAEPIEVFMNDLDDVVSGIGGHAFVIQHLAQRHHHLVDDFAVFDGDVALQVAPIGGEPEAARQMAQHVGVKDGGGDGDLVVGGSQGFADGNEADVTEHQHGARLSIVSHERTLQVGEERRIEKRS